MPSIYVNPAIIEAAFNSALSQPRLLRGNFFSEFRRALRERLADGFSQHGLKARTNLELASANYLKSATVVRLNPIVKYIGSNREIEERLDLEFCARYGHDDYSLKAINYLDCGLCELPSLLPFERVEPFSVGNLVIPVDNTDCELRIEFGTGIHATGYSYEISNRKRKSYICLFGLWFSRDLLKPIIDRYKRQRNQLRDDLDEVRIDIISYPVMFIDRRTGQLYTCSCFADQFDLSIDIIRLLPYGNSEPELEKAVRELQVIKGICHLCTGEVPRFEYGSSMHYSPFLQRYLSYHTLLWRKKSSSAENGENDARTLENQLRERFGYPRVGEKRISETLLFKIIQTLFGGTKVVRHYRGAELGGLELDIWIPDLRLGIEYQGEQHYQVIEPWGAVSGLSKRIENDRKKRQLCKSAGYNLVEFRYEENLTEDRVVKKLRSYLERLREHRT